LYGYRLFSEKLCDEYAAQTVFFQSQAFLFPKKAKGVQKSAISKSGFKKAKLATLRAEALSDHLKSTTL